MSVLLRETHGFKFSLRGWGFLMQRRSRRISVPSHLLPPTKESTEEGGSRYTGGRRLEDVLSTMEATRNSYISYLVKERLWPCDWLETASIYSPILCVLQLRPLHFRHAFILTLACLKRTIIATRGMDNPDGELIDF